MKVSRNLTASIVAALVVGGGIYIVGRDVLKIPMLTAGETMVEPTILNKPAGMPPVAGEEQPFGIEAAGPNSPAPVVQSSDAKTDQVSREDQPFGLTEGGAAPAPLDAARSFEPQAGQAAPEVASEPTLPEATVIADGEKAPGAEENTSRDPQIATGEANEPAPESAPGVVANEPSPVVVDGTPKLVAEPKEAVPSDKPATVAAPKAPIQSSQPTERQPSVAAAQNKAAAGQSSDLGESVIICVAGCETAAKEVYRGRIRESGAGSAMTKVTTPTGDSDAAPKVECVAGCYQTPRSYSARPALPVPGVVNQTGAGKDRRAESWTAMPRIETSEPTP